MESKQVRPQRRFALQTQQHAVYKSADTTHSLYFFIFVAYITVHNIYFQLYLHQQAATITATMQLVASHVTYVSAPVHPEMAYTHTDEQYICDR